MSLSGTIYGSFSDKPTSTNRPLIIWSATQGISGGVGYSYVSATLYFWQSSSTYWAYNTGGTHNNTSNVNASTHLAYTNFDTRTLSGNILIRARSAVTVQHNADGTKNCYIGWSGDTHVSWGTYNFGSTVTLDTITQASVVTTSSASSIDYQSATVGGNVTTAGIPANTDRGIYWGTSSGSQPYKVSAGTGGAGSYSFTLGSLSPNTTYYYKAYTYNTSGYSYGSVVNFTTSAVAPALTSSAMSSIYSIKATANGSITNVYGANATRRGFCYKVGTSGDPVITDSVAYDDGDFGTGSFNKVLTGLSPSTGYRVRPYATNSAGTGYGTTVQLTTLTDEHTLSVSDSIVSREEFNPSLAFRLGELRLIGTYGGYYVGSNYWAGSFENYLYKTFTDSLKVRDNGSSILEAIRSFVESLNLSEAFTKGFASILTFLDEIDVKSGLERLYSMIRGLVESISITDTFGRVVANVREFVESLNLAEAFNASMVYLKGLVDSIVVSDLYSNSIGKVLQSIVVLTDSITSGLAYIRNFVESVILAEVFDTAKLFIKILQDTIHLADNLLQASGRYFVDTINVVENWWKAFVVSFIESISLEDVLSGFKKAYIRVWTEIISISDIVSKGATIVLASVVKLVDLRPVRVLNGILINWSKGIRKALEWAKVVKKEDDFIKIERKLNDWELKEKDLGLYESKVKPLDEWTKLRREK